MTLLGEVESCDNHRFYTQEAQQATQGMPIRPACVWWAEGRSKGRKIEVGAFIGVSRER